MLHLSCERQTFQNYERLVGMVTTNLQQPIGYTIESFRQLGYDCPENQVKLHQLRPLESNLQFLYPYSVACTLAKLQEE